MSKRSFEILFEDDAYIVVNKSAGVLAIQDRYQHDIENLKSTLERKRENIFVVHRIDKGTSGIIVFAKTEEAHKHLNIQFENRLVEKSYTCIVQGTLTKTSGTIETLIAKDERYKGKMLVVNKKGKSAISHYQLIEQFNNYALVEVQIETGRTHQVRVHMAHQRNPLVGDAMYGGKESLSIGDLKRKVIGKSERPLIARPALHAYKISFKDMKGIKRTYKCDPPKDIKATINQLRKWRSI